MTDVKECVLSCVEDLIYCRALEFIMNKEWGKIRELISRRKTKLKKKDTDRLIYL